MRDLVLAGVLSPLLAMAAARPFVGVLVWCWISFMNPHREVWGFATSMPWAMLAFIVTVFGCFVAREPKRPAVNAVTVMLCVFALCITFTSFAALGPRAVVWAKWESTIKVLAGLLLTASLLTERRRIHALVWLMVISLGFYGVKGGIFTLTTGGGFMVLGPPETMIEDRNHLAVALLISIPLMNYLRQQSAHHIVRLGLIAAMAMTLFAVVGSQSRGALVGLIATAAVFWLRSRGKIVSGAALLVGVAAAILFMPQSWVDRMGTIQHYQEESSALGRLNIWYAAFRLAVMRPLTGVGFFGFYDQAIVDLVDPAIRARAAHSIWFEVIGEHGFTGFAIWLGILFCGIFYALRIAHLTKQRPDLVWAYDLARMSQVSIVAYCVGGTFLSLSYWDLFWTLLVVLGATHALVLEALSRQAAREATGWRAKGAALADAGLPAGGQVAAS